MFGKSPAIHSEFSSNKGMILQSLTFQTIYNMILIYCASRVSARLTFEAKGYITWTLYLLYRYIY